MPTEFVGKIEAGPSSPGPKRELLRGPKAPRTPLGPSHVISALYDFFLMFDDRPEHSGTPPGVAPGVSPNAVIESIDSGDFLAGVIRAGVAKAVRQRYTIVVRDSDVRVQQHVPAGVYSACGD